MKLRSKAFVSFVILAIIYASVNLTAAPPRATLQHYHISPAALRLLDTTVILPVLIIWFIGLYGYQKLQTYAAYVKGNKEGDQVALLSKGVTILAFWLPVSSTLSTILNLLALHNHRLLPINAIITNYLSLLFPLAAFIYFSRGSRQLSELTKRRPSPASIHMLVILLSTAGVTFGYLVARSQDKLYSIYHMPLLVVLATLVIPYIFSWYLGLIAVSDMHLYTRWLKGVIYKRSWNALSFGLVWIVIFSIGLQYVTAVSAQLANLSLGWTLLLIYTILPVLAIGYIFVALGAKRLTKIEEV